MQHTICICFVLVSLFSLYSCRTDIANTEICFGIPSSPYHVLGVVIVNSPQRGLKKCFYSPGSTNAYFSIRINNLNLKQLYGVCPTFRLYMYTTVRTDKIDDPEADIREGVEVPADPQPVFSADCRNYTKLLGKVMATNMPGGKIMLEYNPGVYSAPPDAYDVSLSSYVQGQSWSCESGYFRCWSDKYKCIFESMQCDGFDNCYDNSDEEAYKCTGRIAGVQLPLFIIILLISFLVIVCLAVFAVFTIRRRRQRSDEKIESGNWYDMNMGRQETAAYPPGAMPLHSEVPYSTGSPSDVGTSVSRQI